MIISSQEFLASLPLITERIEEYSAGHHQRIASLAETLICAMLRLYPDWMDADEARRTVLYAPLHDIGKLAIPDAILSKKGALSPEEYEVVKTHTVEGARIIEQRVRFETTADKETAINIAMLHHEKHDGSGYPHGLKGDEIPLCARVMAIVDVYDALRSERPYKKALSKENAERIILDGDDRVRPSHFDPMLLNAFRECLDGLDAIYAK